MKTELLDEARTVGRIRCCRVRMRIPSVLATDEEFALQLSVVGPDALPYEQFTETLVFENTLGVVGLPPSFRFENGAWTGEIGGLKAVGPDVAIIRARVEGSGTNYGDPGITSNPAWVLKDPGWRLYWGDIHVHTTFSNCGPWRALNPEWCYQYAREVSFLDFAAIADHLRGIASEPERWPRLQELARIYNEPGRFVALLGFESSHAQGFGGDNNAYYVDDDAPYFWVDRDDMRGINPKVHLKTLWEQLDGNGKPYITIPHHTARMNKYRTWEEDYHDPQREPLFEIYSGWGSSEMRENLFPLSGGNNDDKSYFVDAIKAGARFGVIASSDDHTTLPGGVSSNAAQPFKLPKMQGHGHKGLAAIRAPELTRKALFDSMKRRDTYATTLARSLVEVFVGDASMGQEIKADSALKSKRSIRVRFTLDDARLARVTLMRNGEELETKEMRDRALGEKVNEVVFEDAESLDSIAVRDARYHPEPFVAYYVRIADDGKHHQWTSPVWIDV